MPFRFNPFTDKLDLTETSSSPTGEVDFLTGNSGGQVPPDASHNINVIGNNTQGINIAGNAGTNTLTVSGINATTTQIGVLPLATNAEAIAGTDTTKAITSDDLKAKLGVQTANAIGYGAGTSSAISWTNAGTNGQLVIAATGAAPAFSTVTSADSSITFTTGANSLDLSVNSGSFGKTITGNTGGAISPTAGNWNIIGGSGVTTSGAGSTLTINTSAMGLTWNEVTIITQQMSNANGYVSNNAALVTLTLPAVAAFGTMVAVLGKGAGGWRIAQNAGQQILIGTQSTTAGVGGHIDSTQTHDSVFLLCTIANTTWTVLTMQGNISLT